MGSVTVFTAERSQAIEDSTIVGAEIVDGDLILTRFDGDTINAGQVYMNWYGAWDILTVYPANAIVTHDNSTWISDAPTTAGEEPGVAAVWTLFLTDKVATAGDHMSGDLIMDDAVLAFAASTVDTFEVGGVEAISAPTVYKWSVVDVINGRSVLSTINGAPGLSATEVLDRLKLTKGAGQIANVFETFDDLGVRTFGIDADGVPTTWGGGGLGAPLIRGFLTGDDPDWPRFEASIAGKLVWGDNTLQDVYAERIGAKELAFYMDSNAYALRVEGGGDGDHVTTVGDRLKVVKGDGQTENLLELTDTDGTTVLFSVDNDGLLSAVQGSSFQSVLGSGSAVAYSAKVTGDATNRVEITASGSMSWGDGTNPTDIVLQRQAAAQIGISPPNAATATPTIFNIYSPGASSEVRLRRVNGSITTPTGVLSGEGIGIVNFLGYDGVGTYRSSSRIDGYSSENFSATAAGGHLRFYTVPLGSITPTEAMRITETQGVEIASTGALGTVEKFRVNLPPVVQNNTAVHLSPASSADNAVTSTAAASASASHFIGRTSAGTANAYIDQAGAFNSRPASSGSGSFSAAQAGDSAARFYMTAQGLMVWGDGTNPTDVGFGRLGANQTVTQISGVNGAIYHNVIGTAGQGGIRVRRINAASAAVLNTETIGNFEAFSYDGTTYGECGRISFIAEENQAVGAHGARMTFNTVPVGSATVTERARITNGGVLEVNSTGTPGTVEKFRVNTPGYVSNAATVNFAAAAAADYGVYLSLAAAGTGAPFTTMDSSGLVKTYISAAGCYFSVQSASGNNAYTAQVAGDTFGRIQVTATGAISWGSGSGTTDVTLSRSAADTLLLADGDSLSFGTTTGSKIGTAANQKQAWWGATPVVQPTTAGAAASFTANAGTAINDASTFDGYTIGQVVKALRTIGVLA